MYLLIIILNREEFLEDTLSALVELGITDATILDAQAMGSVLAEEVPIFAGLQFHRRGRRPYCKAILALVQDREIGEELVHILRDIDIDLLEDGAGKIITLEVASVLGSETDLDRMGMEQGL